MGVGHDMSELPHDAFSSVKGEGAGGGSPGKKGDGQASQTRTGTGRRYPRHVMHSCMPVHLRNATVVPC